MSLGLRFAVLGPVRAWRGDTELDLGAGQQRAVLAVLLLADGRQVSLAALVDALWDDPPRAATGMVRTYVSRLRRCLAAGAGDVRDVIKLAGDGYLLPIGSAALDLNAFLRMTNDAQAARRGSTADLARGRDLLREALGLWGGLPLAGVPGPYAEAQQVRLAELRLAAIEERLAADIELGGHAAAVAELQTLLGSHPMRERLSELLMLALYRAGRQADALAVFGKTGDLLREEMGIDPGPGLRDIYQRILQMDESLIGTAQPYSLAAAPEASPLVRPVRPAQLPADLPAFTGRCAELAQLNLLPVNASNAFSALTIVAIDGMAGIGKTTLAVRWAHQVAGQFPDGQLYVNLRGFDPSGAMMNSGAALRRFLHALGVAPQQIPDDVESQAGLYRSVLNGRRVLILLDNARNVEQVRPLLPGSPGSLVIVTSRTALTGLITTHNAGVLTLDQFSAGEAREALARRSGSEGLAAEPDAVAEVIDLCAGLPLAMAIVAARATVYPDRPLTEIARELRDARTRLDALSTDDAATDIRAVFSSSYQLLSSPARRLFRLASLHNGPDFSQGAAASLAGLPVTAVPPLLKELTATRLIIEHRRGRFTFHDLIRVYAAELTAALDSEDDQHAALGQLLDYYLHMAYRAQLRLQPNCMAPPPRPARTGVRPEQLDGHRQAMAWFADERHVLQAAVSKAASTGYYAHAWQLALTLQQFFQRQGHWHDWAATMRTALDAAVDSGDLAGQAYTRRSLARACHFLGRDDEALGELERARELFTELGYSTRRRSGFSERP